VLRTLSGAKSNCMQNYQSTMESPKLSIETTVMQAVNIKKDITLPYYFKNEHGRPCKIVTPEVFITVINSPAGPLVSANLVKYGLTEIAKGTECTEVEFESAFSQAMMHLQLLNDDSQPSNERDVNEEIDEMRERREAV
jgi:hypothetical protein